LESRQSFECALDSWSRAFFRSLALCGVLLAVAPAAQKKGGNSLLFEEVWLDK